MTAVQLAKVLLVDDEQRVLDGLSLLLGRRYTVVTAIGGAQALTRLESERDIAVVVSDMRMPGMSGAQFLAQVHRMAPTTVRMLLTGQTDIEAAIVAINEGQIFRFLTKPASPKDVMAAVDAGVLQHRLMLGERALLEQTLRGSIQTLTDVLSLANPLLFGRATRIKRIVNQLMRKASMADHWQIDVAAMLLPLAQMSLPVETADKLCRDAELSDEERAMVARLPELTDNLLTHIPRLETVRVILAQAQEPYRQSNCIEPADDAHIVLKGAQLLRLAIAFDALTQGGRSNEDALSILREQTGRFDATLLGALGELYPAGAGSRKSVQIPIKGLAAGMVLAEDLVTRTGVLLVPHGCEVTASFVERIRNYKPGSLNGSVRIVVGG